LKLLTKAGSAARALEILGEPRPNSGLDLQPQTVIAYDAGP
jgi:hypothetical protein